MQTVKTDFTVHKSFIYEVLISFSTSKRRVLQLKQKIVFTKRFARILLVRTANYYKLGSNGSFERPFNWQQSIPRKPTTVGCTCPEKVAIGISNFRACEAARKIVGGGGGTGPATMAGLRKRRRSARKSAFSSPSPGTQPLSLLASSPLLLPFRKLRKPSALSHF